MAQLAYKYEVLASSNHSDRSGFSDYTGEITHICIHHWGDDGQSHSAVVAWLRGAAGNRSNTRSSAHYVCSAGLVTNLVGEHRAAWAAIGANGYAIHIEARPEMSAGDWATLVQLCCNIEERRGSMKYIRHLDVAATKCPGRYSKRMAKLVKDINNEHKRRGNDPNDPRRKRKSGAPESRQTSSRPAPKPKTPKRTPKRSSSYSGPSIVEYLKSIGQSSSYSARATLARRHGISNYRGTAAQNTALLRKLRGGSNSRRAKSVSTMASEVIRGDHGNGHAQRRASLGVDAKTYAKVRSEVNRRLKRR